MITIKIMKEIVLIRDGSNQKVSCIVIITRKLVISRRLVEPLMDINEAGSNEEKISIIIKTWIFHLVL